MSPLSPPQKVYPGKQHISNEPSRCTLSLLSPYLLHNRGPELSVSNLLILPHTHIMQPPPSITNATPPKITKLPGQLSRRRLALDFFLIVLHAYPPAYLRIPARHPPSLPFSALSSPSPQIKEKKPSSTPPPLPDAKPPPPFRLRKSCPDRSGLVVPVSPLR